MRVYSRFFIFNPQIYKYFLTHPKLLRIARLPFFVSLSGEIILWFPTERRKKCKYINKSFQVVFISKWKQTSFIHSFIHFRLFNHIFPAICTFSVFFSLLLFVDVLMLAMLIWAVFSLKKTLFIQPFPVSLLTTVETPPESLTVFSE